MTTFFFQIICAYLFVIGTLFCLIEIRTQFDKHFFYSGITIILAGLFSSIDIWFLPGATSSVSVLYWTKIQHVIAVLLAPALILHITSLTRKRFRHLRILLFMVMVVSALLLTNRLIRVEGNEIRTTLLYNVVFIPFVLFFMVSFLRLLIAEIKSPDSQEKKVLWSNLIGFIVLMLCGVFDLFSFTLEGNSTSPIRSATVLGILGFGIMYSVLFSERFLGIVNDRKEAYAKLKSAFKELEEVNSLKKLGEASAMVNHEIGNYLFIISSQAELLKEMHPLSEQEMAHVNNILSTVERLNNFSQDILDLSKSQIIKNKKPIRISEVAKSCASIHFPKARAQFRFILPENEPPIYGDWGKLEQVFRNIFKNSLDAAVAGDTLITVKVQAHSNLLLLSVEDNGVGCTQEQLEGIFKAFFTTKQGRKGTGLGMSITKSIIQAHGGTITAYSKNLENRGEHGLQLQIVIPIYDMADQTKTAGRPMIALVREGLPEWKSVVDILQNVNVNPLVVDRLSDVDRDQIGDGIRKLVLSTKALAAKLPRNFENNGLFLLSEYNGSFFVLNGSSSGNPELFSEEYVAVHLA